MVNCTRGLEVTSNFVIKLHDIHNGLHLALNKNLLLLYIELDYLAMENLLNSNLSSYSTHVNVLVANCRRMPQLLGQPTIAHSYKEGNQVANFLAKLVLGSSNDLYILEQPLMRTLISLMHDSGETFMPKLVRLL